MHRGVAISGRNTQIYCFDHMSLPWFNRLGILTARVGRYRDRIDGGWRRRSGDSAAAQDTGGFGLFLFLYLDHCYMDTT